MATVYLAKDLRHEREVALKVLLPDLTAVLGPARFLREIRTVAGLNHPHILPLLDSGEAAGTLFYVMPLATGESLRQRLTREAQLPIDEALEITRDVAGALAYAHSRGIVHRDIKPDNILLSAGHAVVADFGIAAVLGVAGDDRLTESGMSIGTPSYMSPEQASGNSVDARSDIYSLGCVLYEMLAGGPPFSGPSAQAVVARHLADPAPSIRTVRATVPVMLERAVMKALAKVPADRFETAAAFARALSQQVNPLDDEPAPKRARLSTPRMRWAAVIGLALILGIGAIAGATGFWGGRTAREGIIKSLAVLPFVSDTAQIYLAAGVTDQILTTLNHIDSSLRVIPIRSGGNAAATERILKDNQIDATLDGSLVRVGNAVRVAVHLNSAGTSRLLWSRVFDDSMPAILVLQAEVAESVAVQMRASLTPQVRSRMAAARPTVSTAAYDAYVTGRYLHSRAVAGAEFHRAIDYLKLAIREDSTYAPAWSELAGVYANVGYLGIEAPDQAFPVARDAALTALRLDSSLADAYRALGQVQLFSLWDFNASERSIRHAIELGPNGANTHFNYGMVLTALNRSDAAIAELKRAQELDPGSLIIHAAAARPYYNARQYDDAISQSLRTLELDSSFGRALYWLGLSYEETSRPADAVRVLRQLAAQAPMPVYQAALGHAYAAAGRRAEALVILRQLMTPSGGRYVSPYDVATVQAGLGDRAATLDWLDRAYTARAPYLVFVAVDPHFDAYHADPRFRDLLRRIGLPATS